MSRATSPKNYFVFKAPKSKASKSKASNQSIVSECGTYAAAVAVASKAAKSDAKHSYRVAMVTEVFQQTQHVESIVERREVN